MRAANRVRDVFRGLVQRYGSSNIKRHLWNYEYSEGRWRCLGTMAGDCIYPHVEKYARNGSILDLGCGPGAVENELNPSAYHSYTGVDICDVAIEKAKTRTSENGRTDKNNCVRSDILSYVPEEQYDVIMFGDSIYYFPSRRISGILDRYSKYLEQGGVFILRSWMLKEKHRTLISNIQRDFEVLEKHLYHNSQMAVITFRVPARRGSAEKNAGPVMSYAPSRPRPTHSNYRSRRFSGHNGATCAA